MKKVKSMLPTLFCVAYFFKRFYAPEFFSLKIRCWHSCFFEEDSPNGELFTLKKFPFSGKRMNQYCLKVSMLVAFYMPALRQLLLNQ